MLTPEEREAVTNGEDIKIVLKLEDGTSIVSDEDKEAVEAALNGSEDLKLGQYFKIELFKLVGGVETGITQTAKPVCMAETFSVPITAMLLVNLFIIALVLAIAAPPVPGGFAACITILITQLGISEAAIPLVIAMSMILDFLCTATNLFCLQAELIELAGGLDMLDTEILRTNPMNTSC